MSNNVRYLGIDPGTNFLGFAVIEIISKKVRVLEIGVLNLSKEKDHIEKLRHIYHHIQDLIEQFEPKEMAIEAPFYGKNVQSMLKLGRAQGVCMAAAITMDVTVQEYSPRKIKQSVTGNGNSSKEQVAAMLNSILKFEVSSNYLDATDALATALCHYYQSGSKISGQKRYKDWSSYLSDNPNKKAK